MKPLQFWFDQPWRLSLGLVVVMAGRTGLTSLGDPLGSGVDAGLWGVACGLKLLVWLALLKALPRLYRRCQGSPRSAARFAASFALLLACTLLLLAHQRALVAAVVSNPAIKYYPPTAATINPQAYVGFGQWLPRWQSGQVLLAETLFVMVLAAGHGAVGLLCGHRPNIARMVGLLGTLGLGVGQWVAFDLIVFDYDIFHGDIISGGFLLDLVFPFVSDPYALFGSLVYLMFSLAAAPLLRRSATGPTR